MVTQSEPLVGEAGLIRDHLPLVGHVVHEFLARVPSHVQRDDLVSAGMFALVQAARSFDATLGVPFARFASCRIRGAILDELRGMDWASRSVRRHAREIDSIMTTLTGTLGRTPTRREVAAAGGFTETELAAHDADVARANVTSIHALLECDEPRLGAEDSLEPMTVMLYRERMAYLSDAISELPPRLRHVIEGYFLHERPMAALAAELGVTESRISQMRAEALTLLHEALDELLEKGVVPPEHVVGVGSRRRAAYVRAVASVRPPLHRIGRTRNLELIQPA